MDLLFATVMSELCSGVTCLEIGFCMFGPTQILLLSSLFLLTFPSAMCCFM